PDSGTCTVLGFDTVKQKYQLIPKIGYLSQKFSLYGDLSVDENIDFFASIHNVKNYKPKKDELLNYMGLFQFRNRLAGALSGGMKQKLALTCTLIHTPEIIFLDEPTNGVDPVARRDFWEILKNIASQGVSIIISTPYIDEAEKCDYIAFMNKGSVISCDTPAVIKSKYPDHLFEISSNDVHEAKKIIETAADIKSVQIFGNKLHAGVARNTEGQSYLSVILKDKVNIENIREIKPTLEDVFIDLLENGVKND
ncbi:MAG TPA: ABC transporter ATP-binding protein, partial [bacterium]|nr:ABC transporter ATP-binding protein [bacterium]